MTVAGGLADVHDVNDLLRHAGFVCVLVSVVQFFLDEVEGEQESIFPKKCIVLLFITTLADDISRAEERTAVVNDAAGLGIQILLLERRTLGHEDIPGFLQSLGRFDIPALVKTALLILSDLADHLVVEVLDEMEVVEYRLNVGTAFLKRLLKVGIHVAGDSLHAVHPFQTDMVDEVIDDLFLLAVGDPEDVPGLHVDDVGCVLPAVMELEFIYAEDPRGLLRLDESFPAYGVEFLQPLLVDVLDHILSQPGDLRHLFVGICPVGQEIFRVLIKLFCHPVTHGFEGDELALSRPAGRALEPIMRKEHAAQVAAEAQMSQGDIRVCVDVHTRSAFAHAILFFYGKSTPETDHSASRLGSFCGCPLVFEAVQAGRNAEVVCCFLKNQLTAGLSAYILHLEEPPLGRSICLAGHTPILIEGSSLFNSFA